VRVWVDLANSPHVPVFEPILDELRRAGHEPLITARDHAQTVELARRVEPALTVVGGESPPGKAAKAAAIGTRATALRRFARRRRPDVAISHGSYAQVVAARLAGVPAVTMMDYDHQPANHVSFRLAQRVIVPRAFPAGALRRFGANGRRTLRYDGYKEELYLADLKPDRGVLEELRLDPGRVIAVLRPPPDGALYHRVENARFDELLDEGRQTDGAQLVVLPRSAEQRDRYERVDGLTVPARAVDGRSLLAFADLTIGAGGTMNRESALLGTPTYTVFAGELGAVDAQLIREGLMHDLRDPATRPRFEKKPDGRRRVPGERRDAILGVVTSALDAVAGRG
jgi:predicted glycosyltransferase